MSACEVDWPTVFEGFKSAGSVVSWGLVILGWYFVSKDHNRREHRKEIRAVLNQIESSIRHIEETAHQYYLKAGSASDIGSISLKIKRDIKRLSGDLARLHAVCASIEFKPELIVFRSTITGGDFDVKRRAASSSDSTKLGDISSAADELIDILESGFVSRFAKDKKSN